MKRLLVISFSYPRPIKRDKLVHLQKEFDLHLIHPATYTDPYQEDPGHPIAVTLVKHRFLFTHKPNPPRIWMELPVRWMRQFNPDFIYMEAELWCPTIWWIIVLRRLHILRGKLVVHCAANKFATGWKGIFRKLIYRIASIELSGLVGSSIGVTEVNRRLCGSETLAYGTFPHIGPSADRFHPEQRPSPSREFHLGYVGRLSEEKGVRYLITAYQRLPASIREKSCLHIYGEGPEKGMLQTLTIRDSRIFFEGYVDAEKVPDVLGRLDALILPSVETNRDREQWGLVLVEAMLSGIPIIGTDVGAIPEVLHGFGSIVPQRQVEPLAQELRKQITDAAAMKARAMKSREYAIVHYSGEALAQRLGKFLKDLK